MDINLDVFESEKDTPRSSPTMKIDDIVPSPYLLVDISFNVSIE